MDANAQQQAIYTRDPVDLHPQIGQHDALFSVSFVLEFFDNVIWEESDLYIFVQRGNGDPLS